MGKANRQTVRFSNTALGSGPGASKEFIEAYKSLESAIKSGDRATANSALHGLQPNNLYESASLGLATAMYAANWGTASQQLAGLQRAIGRDKRQRYLPPPLSKAALLATCSSS